MNKNQPNLPKTTYMLVDTKKPDTYPWCEVGRRVTVLSSQLCREDLMVSGRLFHSVTPRPVQEVKAAVGGEVKPVSTSAVISNVSNNILAEEGRLFISGLKQIVLMFLNIFFLRPSYFLPCQFISI